VPPGASNPIVANLGEHGLNASCPHGRAATRLLVEKPFGYDLPSARELIAETAKYFGEEQIFRIDHYLAKETVQNILTFRFNNPIFETIWDAEHIARVDVVATETIGIEGRATFYEQTGALRDLVQSHLLQLLATATMERPSEMASDAVHAERLKLLQAVEPVPADKTGERAVRGQYDGYKKEVSNDDSFVETFASLKLFIDSPRWQNVPMHITTGKALDVKKTEVNITFKQHATGSHTNVLTFSVQPNEGIDINLCVKKPGFDDQIQSAVMDFSYQRAFDDHGHPDAYERVLVDAVRGDHTLFATSDEVLASWHILQPVLETWTKNGDDLKTYKQNTAGPINS
jgi:glucose-6-phosphate 1-dehydrogenase